jgi:hypothetical protein
VLGGSFQQSPRRISDRGAGKGRRGSPNLFDEAFLAAGDERYDSFSFPARPVRLSDLKQLAKRVSNYYSIVDAVLCFSMFVNLGSKTARARRAARSL